MCNYVWQKYNIHYILANGADLLLLSKVTHILSVDLYDTTGEHDVHVNQKLVECLFGAHSVNGELSSLGNFFRAFFFPC